MKQLDPVLDRRDPALSLGFVFAIWVFGGLYGFIYEYIFYWLNSGCKTFYWRGDCFAPWIGLYGVGILLIVAVCRKMRRHPIVVFFVSGALCTILEYAAGAANAAKGIYQWDYNAEIANWGNINGYICLRSALFFALSAVLSVYLFIPLIDRMKKAMSRKVFISLTYVTGILFIADNLYNRVFAALLGTPSANQIYGALGMHFMHFG